MVTLECLDAFDHLIWLRTGSRAAEVQGCNQSTISRYSMKCQHVFHLRLRKISAEWVVTGDVELLQAERRLHQRYRWEMDLPLRFECQHWMRDCYAMWQSPGWIKGNLNYGEYERPLHLLKSGIIDAWICSAPDLPADPDLTCVQLFKMPMLLVARRDHPLLRRPQPLTLAEAAAFPLLPLPYGASPVVEARLKALGLVGLPVGHPPDSSGPAEDGASFADRCLGIASALTLSLYGEDYVPLPLEIPIHFGDALVIRSEFARHRRCRQLIDSLLAHVKAVTAGMVGVPMLDPQAVLSVRTPVRLR